MKLVIDRNSTDKDFYIVDYGVDWDVMIGTWKIPSKFVTPEAMAEADRIITKSAELKWCVMYIKHPLLLKSYTEEKPLNTFWTDVDERFLKSQLRNYFAVRLKYRRFPVELTEIGKRLFVD